MRKKKSVNNKGSILITTLWIIATLTVFAMGIGFRASLEARLSKYNMDKTEARYLAKAGLYKAMERIGDNTNEYDTVYECGIALETRSDTEEGEAQETTKEIFGKDSNPMGNGSFSVHYKMKGEGDKLRTVYGLMDEERKININISKLMIATDREAEYKRVLSALSDDLTEEMLNSMLDWQDTDDSVSTPGGAEDFDYDAEFGYLCKDADFEALEELMLVKGMTWDIFKEIEKYITVYGDGAVNINTAPEEVLLALIDDGSGQFGELVDSIMIFRKGDDGLEGTSDDRFFLTIDDVNALIENVSIDENQKNMFVNRIDYVNALVALSFKSSAYRILSHGYVGRVTKVIDCVITRGAEEEGASMAYYHEE